MRLELMLVAALAAAGATGAVAQTAPKPTIPKVCMNCHKAEAGAVSGYFENVAFKSQSIQLGIDDVKEIVRFDEKTLKVIDAGDAKKPEHLREVRKGHETLVRYVERDGQKWATEIRFKGPVKVAKADLADYAFVRKLVDQGKGNFALIDSRPLPRFQQGTIPGAINVPYPAWDKVVNRLPADKNALLVFFCQGVTCQMSPLSQRKAIALGYRNTKVYHQGIPEWETRDYLVTQPQFVKEAYVDKGIPVVLLDARRAEFAQTAHLAGAVAMTPQQVAAGAKKAFPDPKLKAPIIVYDGVGGEAAVAAARALVRAGQSNVQVMQGGLIAWQSAGYGVETGKAAATQVVYVPKPRPGSVPAEEFTKLATNTPADVLILDVRNQDEANNGMIKGALLIPEEDLSGRMGEVPKDKRIIAHCATGIRAEMAYHKLKDAGYKAGFLNADIEIAKDGSFKLSPKL